MKEILVKMHSALHVKNPLLLSNCNQNWIFSTSFRKIRKYKLSWKSVLWEPSCSVRTEWPTWRNSQSLFATLQMRLKINPPPSPLQFSLECCYFFCLGCKCNLSNFLYSYVRASYYNYKLQPIRCNVSWIHLFLQTLYMFQVIPPPIIRST